ncbi:kinase-like domain-containing protein, partial [Gigaspora rosea]
GRRYYYGKGVDQDYNQAFEYLKKSAIIGSSTSAMYNVGNCYRNGIGTKRDIQSANYWFRKCHINPELKKILDDERFKLSWIDYNEFKIFRELGKGGFATVYFARWFDRINDTWVDVALKVIHNSNEHEQEFIQELQYYCEIGYANPSFLNCHGVSRNDYGNYIIVMDIAPEGSLRQNLVEVSQLEWKDKLNILIGIAIDLESIHSQELVHRDLHSGNILQEYLNNAYITDLKMKKKEKFVVFFHI